jgi:molecular chaperone DnaK
VDQLNTAFNQLQTASHKLAEALYQQAPPPGADTAGAAGGQASAAGASSSGGSPDDNVIDAEYVDVEDNK